MFMTLMENELHIRIVPVPASGFPQTESTILKYLRP